MLWLFVLEDAIQCLHGTYVPGGDEVYQSGARWRLTRDARLWFASDEVMCGTFAWICQLLDLDPGFVRKILAEGITLKPRARRSPVSSSEHPTVARAHRNGV